MKLDLGMYIRTRKGKIAKIIKAKREYPSPNVYTYVWELDDKTSISMSTSKIVKYSYNIIDLIEVGDYVDGDLVGDIRKYKNGNVESIEVGELSVTVKNKDIKSIVTKEQFESMAYKVVE